MSYLFVYGTLLTQNNNEMATLLQANSEFIGNAYFYGKLYNIGWYPGAVLSNIKSELVHGQVFKIQKEYIFKTLDNYEGIGDTFIKPNQYRKEYITAYLQNHQTLKVYAYIYNHPTENLLLIPSGNYIEWCVKQ